MRIDPILDDQQHVIGARWYGTPIANLNAIINHTTTTVVIWGVIAADRRARIRRRPSCSVLSNTLDQRSKQVRDAAKELGVAIVGSEVSGDHVAMTKAAVERSSTLIDELYAQSAPSPKLAELKVGQCRTPERHHRDRYAFTRDEQPHAARGQSRNGAQRGRGGANATRNGRGGLKAVTVMADLILFFGSNADTMIATKALKDAGIAAKMIPETRHASTRPRTCACQSTAAPSRKRSPRYRAPAFALGGVVK